MNVLFQITQKYLVLFFFLAYTSANKAGLSICCSDTRSGFLDPTTTLKSCIDFGAVLVPTWTANSSSVLKSRATCSSLRLMLPPLRGGSEISMKKMNEAKTTMHTLPVVYPVA